ncbi:hypothetical protein RRG08_051294 [Elysia crispata]|uniref:Uncharacterized protein n=1 Tax=Elysia crispata TaxID=231223 RepID=A0AAE0XRV8_9GAST|nr:hypothetical protein RRG08_051294 [Elysia crispata]
MKLMLIRDGTLQQPCNTFTNQDGDCIAQNGPDDMFCSCCCQTSSSLRTGFNITAQLDVSNGTVYLRWPGPTTDIFSETYRLPEVRGRLMTPCLLTVL